MLPRGIFLLLRPKYDVYGVKALVLVILLLLSSTPCTVKICPRSLVELKEYVGITLLGIRHG
jgi:hypothetical protein